METQLLFPKNGAQPFPQMFNESALLLDDALKPVTPLTNGAISGSLA